MMFNFTDILANLRATIAAHAARDRSLTVLLVAVWGRIARMGTRLDRLVAQWRAGTLPAPRTPRVRAAAPAASTTLRLPRSRAWLVVRVRDAVAFGSQLQHLLTDAECAAFLAAVPQARRILRPLFHMLGVDPAPEAVRRPPPVVLGRVRAAAPQTHADPITIAPVPLFSAA